MATLAGGWVLQYKKSAKYLTGFLNKVEEEGVDVVALITEDSAAKSSRDEDINEALKAAEHLTQNGKTVTFCSKVADYHNASSNDWSNAIGNYCTKIKCTATRNGNSYTATITYYVYDVYDWNKAIEDRGNKPVSQRELWELQYGGLAKGYYVAGNCTYEVTWTKGQRIGSGAGITG